MGDTNDILLECSSAENLKGSDGAEVPSLPFFNQISEIYREAHPMLLQYGKVCPS